MDWEKNWQSWRGKTDMEVLTEQWGPIVGNFLASLDPREPARDRYQRLYRRLWEHFDGEIPEVIQEEFIKSPHKDYILENLQSHDVKELERAIDKHYLHSQRFREFSGKEGKTYLRWTPTGTDEIPPIEVYEEIKDSWEKWRKNPKETFTIQKIAEFYGYYVSDVDMGFIDFEPYYPADATEFVQKDCRGYVYHVAASRKELETILKVGLRPKNGPTWDWSSGQPTRIPKQDQYRYFPERIFAYATTAEGMELQEELEHLARRVGGNMACVLQMYVGGLTFYWDTAMYDEHSVFTYGSIPPGKIRQIEF